MATNEKRPEILPGDVVLYYATGRVQSVQDSTIHTESEDGEEVSRANIVSIERDGRVVWDKLSMMKPVYTSHTSHVGDLRVWNCKHTGFNTGESDD